MSTAEVKILLFGMIAEKLKATEVYLNNVSNTEELRAALLAKFPQLSNLKFLISLNRQVVQQNMPIAAGCEIALLPPYSGG
jgi:molybdopterin synthase sulfur carrier subunit